jgi:hypothetical protein
MGFSSRSRTGTHRARRMLAALTIGTLMSVLSVTSVFAAGPQPLPEQACNQGTRTAGDRAPNRTSSEAIPHIEHAEFLPPVPYCHHFNPTAQPPAGL